MKERPDVINGLRQTGVYSLISLLAWQPILVRADVAPTELPKANVDWVSQGAATRVETATDMTVKQISDRVSLQWDTFNIGDKASVKFDQPNSSSIALNRVQGGSGSRINGKLSANGIIYIVDSNGVIFGRNSIVEVASLVATALNVDEDLIMNESFVKAINDYKAAFEGGAGENAAIVLEGSIDGAEGARIVTGEGGSVFLFAPKIETQSGSSITTPGGQTILAAAKDQIFLAASQDPDLRGLLVEVNEGGDIDHAGKIVADRGNITLAALNIDQRGQLKATTSVNANGTIRLLARDKANASTIGALGDATLQNQLLAGVLMADGEVDSDMKASDAKYAKSTHTGRVTLHEGSVTEVVPESSSKTSADSNVQPVSFVEVMGKTIEVKDRASITSRGGVVSLVATEKPDDPMAVGTVGNDASVTLHSGSRIDVSGMDTAVVAMERNSLEIELRGDELKDSPLQRNDADIRGETAFVDIRDTDDIEFADISAYLAKIERTVDERLSAGGKVNVYSEGNVDFQQGAQVDVSGGAVHYKSGYVLESQLVDNGNLVYISDADPNVNYDAVISGNERYNARWNVVEKIKSSSVGAGKGTFVKGYVEGKDAGSFNIKSRAADYGGTVTADTVSGPYQRTGSNQVSGGKIDLDLSHFDFSQQAIALVAESEYQQYLRDKLAGTADAGTTTISVERFAGSADSLSIKTRNDLSLAEGTALTLDGNGALDLKGGDVSIQGDITNRAGAVAIAAAEFQSSNTTSVHTLSVGADVTIDTGGAWINDNPLLGANLNAPVNMDAGAIKLTSDGSVQVAQGANLLANGGAWLNAKGKLQGGKGGDVTVSASRFEYGGTLEYSGNASSHSLEQGGKLTLAGAGFHIGPPAPGVNDNAPGVIQLAADELRAGGFSKLVLDAGLNGIDVADGTRIDLVGEQFRMREGNYRTVASGADMNSLAQVVDTAGLREDWRAGIDLSLKSADAPGSIADGIRIGEGAVIQGVPGATITLKAAGGSIDHAGSIIAQGGTVSLAVSSSEHVDRRNSLDSDLAVILRDGSQIDVSATTVTGEVNALGIADRTFHAAGRVSIAADAGYILGDEGASIRADGLVSANRYYDARAGRVVSEPVSLAAGAIHLKASEGMFLNSGLSARAAAGGKAGSLGVTMTTDNRFTGAIDDRDRSFADYELEIRVSDQATDSGFLQQLQDTGNIVATVGGNQQYDNGVAYLNVDAINAGGFGNIGLHALNDENPQTNHADVVRRPESRVTFATDKTLTASESIRLETPAIVVEGSDASVVAPYVAIGTRYTDVVNSAAGDGPLPLNGSFTANAGFIDLVGDIAFRDAEKVALNSHGDIRLRGGLAKAGSRDLPTGSLTAYGDVDLLASQIYSATQTSYSFDLLSTDSTISVRGESSDGAFSIEDDYAVYSALGSITVNADNIVQDGILKAPFGTINLNARQSLVLENGSKTSVSGEAQTVIMGEVQADGSWLYPVQPGSPQVIRTLGEKSVSLTSPAIEHQDGAVVDISGGGDLLAYEFVPGPGGSKDVLSYALTGVAGESFAIVPTYGSKWAAYDTIEMANFPYAIGDTIRFEAGSGLDPNMSYAVMPARYALLPGALLVTPQGYSTQPGLKIETAAGSTVIAGKLGNAGSGVSDSLWSAYVVEPGSVALTRSEFNLYSASEFFTASGTRPQDAGRVLYDAISQLDIDGDILASVSGNGVGGRMDVTAENITLVGAKSDAIEGIQLVAGELEQLNVDSMLLGGTRSAGADGTSIAVNANTVTVAGDVDMTASELLLAAQQTVKVESAARINATRAGKTAGGVVNIEGDGALLQASVGDAVQVQRSNATGSTGVLEIQSGASVIGQGALVLDASGSAIVQGQIDTFGTAGFGSGKMVLGASEAASGMALSQAALNNLNARELLLTSLSTIDIASDFTLDVNRLTLDATAINAVGAVPLDVQFNAAESITLKNSTGSMAEDVAQVGGQIGFNTAAVKFTGGSDSLSTMKLSGFDAAQITATDVTRASGKFALQSSADMNLATAQLQAANGTDLNLQAAGDLVVSSTGVVPLSQQDGLGAHLNFAGDHVSLDTNVHAASGVIDVQAQNGISLGNQAALSVAGRVTDFAGDTVVSDAGTVRLKTANGDIVTQTGTVIDISSPHVDAASGTLELSAANGAVDLKSAPIVQRLAQSTGGKVNVDVAQGSNVQSLLPQLAGFGDTQTWRARNGDIELASGNNVKAGNIEFSADGGAVVVGSRLDASGAEGGTIGLFGRDDVRLDATAQLDASATGPDKDGGKVVLSSRQGFVDLADGSRIHVAGNGDGIRDGNGGTVQFQVQRNATNDDVNFNDAGVRITGADSIVVAGFKRYDTAVVDQSLLDGEVSSETASFMNAMAAKLADLSGRFRNLLNRNPETFEVAPGVEFVSAGDLAIEGGINLAPTLTVDSAGNGTWNDSWRYGDNLTPGYMRFLAGGNLNIIGNVSDGFITLPGYQQTAPIAARSWNFAFAAGADAGAAKVLTTTDTGNIDMAAGSLVRTGTGAIDMAAGGDLYLADGSAIYSGGQSEYATDGTVYVPDAGTLYHRFWFASLLKGRKRMFYGHDGGDINIDVGNDIAVAGSSVPSTEWLYRIDYDRTPTSNETKYISTWGLLYDKFVNGIGTLGGGDIDVSAGHDVINLTLAAPTTAMQIGANPLNGVGGTNEVLVQGGGNIYLQSGNDILSGNYLVGDGRLEVEAGGSLARASEENVATSVVYGVGDISLKARNSIEITRVMDQGFVPVSDSQSPYLGIIYTKNIYITDNSADTLRVESLTGDIHFKPDSAGEFAENLRSVLPVKVQAAALDGNVVFDNSIALEPGAGNALNIYAAHNIEWLNQSILRLSAVPGNLLPSMGSAHHYDSTDLNSDGNLDLLSALGVFDNLVALQNGLPSIHTEPMADPLRLVTLDGDLLADGGGTNLTTSRETEIVAGRDIDNVGISVTNNFASDVSSVRVGRDIITRSTRNDQGAIDTNNASNGIAVNGPGTLLVTAGRDISMGTSGGIVSNGDITNTALADTGADLLVLAGIADDPDFAGFASRYINGSDDDLALASFLAAAFTDLVLEPDAIQALLNLSLSPEQIAALPGAVPADMATALSSSDGKNLSNAQRLFLSLSREDRIQVARTQFASSNERQQQVLVYNTLLNEVKRGGYEDSKKSSLKGFDPETDGFKRSFAAINSLFDENKQWDGDVSLVFSTLNTKDGGDVGVITPGGGIDVGLPIQLPGVTKGAAELGIISTRTGDLSLLVNDSIRVNQSRTFALDGDIMMWASEGDIDAGRGAKTATGAANVNVTIDATGKVVVDYGAVIAGSGIRGAGDVSLFAPAGIIDAGDAGIGARGNITLAAQQVVGADNIDVGGVSIGVPTNTGVSAGVTTAGSVGSAATSASMGEVAEQAEGGDEATEQVAFLTVEIIGLGD